MKHECKADITIHRPFSNKKLTEQFVSISTVEEQRRTMQISTVSYIQQNGLHRRKGVFCCCREVKGTTKYKETDPDHLTYIIDKNYLGIF